MSNRECIRHPFHCLNRATYQIRNNACYDEDHHFEMTQIQSLKFAKNAESFLSHKFSSPNYENNMTGLFQSVTGYFKTTYIAVRQVPRTVIWRITTSHNISESQILTEVEGRHAYGFISVKCLHRTSLPRAITPCCTCKIGGSRKCCRRFKSSRMLSHSDC